MPETVAHHTALQRVCGFKNPIPYPVDLGEPPVAPKYMLMLNGTPASPIARLPSKRAEQARGQRIDRSICKDQPVLVNSKPVYSEPDENESNSDIGEAFELSSLRELKHDAASAHGGPSTTPRNKRTHTQLLQVGSSTQAAQSGLVFDDVPTTQQQRSVFRTPEQTSYPDACPDSGMSIEHEILSEKQRLPHNQQQDYHQSAEVPVPNFRLSTETIIEAEDINSPAPVQRQVDAPAALSLPTDLGFGTTTSESKKDDVHFEAQFLSRVPTAVGRSSSPVTLLQSPTRPSIPHATPQETTSTPVEWDDWDDRQSSTSNTKQAEVEHARRRPLPSMPRPTRQGRPLPPSARPKPYAPSRPGGAAASGRARLLMQTKQKAHTTQGAPPPQGVAAEGKAHDAGSAVDEDFVTADWDT